MSITEQVSENDEAVQIIEAVREAYDDGLSIEEVITVLCEYTDRETADAIAHSVFYEKFDETLSDLEKRRSRALEHYRSGINA